MRRLLFCLLATLLPLDAQRIITTFAGADWVFPPNVTNGREAPIGSLQSVAMDSQGNLYLPDGDNHIVLKIDRSGGVSVFAGNGIRGFSGDGGLAINASLSAPGAVVFDTAGNLYIGDSGNNRIRRVGLNGVITTFAGNGGSAGGGDGGPATNASLAGISALVFDTTGNLYVSDTESHTIRRIDTNRIINRFAGNGREASTGDGGSALEAALNAPWGMAFTPTGDMYVAEFNGYRIRRIRNGVISTFAGTGTRGYSGDGANAIQANLLDPVGLAFDRQGNLIVTVNSRIRSISPAGIISTIAGDGNQRFAGDGGPATSASFYFAEGVVVAADGTIYVADAANSRLRSFRAGGNVTTVAGNAQFRISAPGAPPLQTYLGRPNSLHIDRRGNLLVSDGSIHTLFQYAPNGAFSTRAGTFNTAGCCGDGNDPLDSLFFNPGGFKALDDGSIILADTGNNRIRRISPTGAVSSIAGGTGNIRGTGFSGDGGLAVNALINNPRDIAVDSKGNIYFSDEGNHRIRRIGTDSRITTFAGTATPGFSGDGGQATLARLDTPQGLAIDAQDNLYIADFFNERIRKVTPAGVISTFAGNGGSGASSDGAPAIQTPIGSPIRMTFANSGALYFTDYFGHAVRRIDPDGRIFNVAGSGKSGFSGDGGAATGAAFSNPVGLAIDSAGVLYVADGGNAKIRAILTSPASLQVSPSSLNFSGKAGGSATAPAVVSVSSTLNGLPSPGLAFSVSVDQAARSWLVANASTATTPQDIQLTANPSGLAAGTYRATVTIAAPGAANSPITVAVVFIVTAGDPTKLKVDPSTISLALAQGGTAVTSLVNVSNTGSGTLAFNASTSGGPWLSVTPPSGSATPNESAGLTVNLNPAGLQPGTYTGAVNVTSGSDTQSVKVFLTVNPRPRTILLSQTGLTFLAVAGGGSPLPKNFGILNIGSGSMDWSATVSAPDGSAVPWLQMSPGSGTVARAYLDVSFVDVTVNASNMAPGTYQAQIKVRADADNSPLSVTVVLNVLPAGSRIPPEVRPSGLIFTGLQGSSPGSQTVQFATTGAAPLFYRSSTFTLDGGEWLVAVPSSGVFAPNQPGRMIVQPNFATLTEGIRYGFVTVGFEDGTSQPVNVLTVVPPLGTVFDKATNAATGCPQTQLKIQFPNAADNFSVAVGSPSNFEVQVVDNCGVPVTGPTNASVKVSFRSGDPTIDLVHTSNGRWSRTWTPRSQGTGGQTIATTTAFVTLPGAKILAEQVDSVVNIRSVSNLPLIANGAVVNGASFASDAPVAPGMLVTIFGNNLAEGPGQVSGTVPVPTELAGAEVRLNDKPLPLFFASNGQLNAQVPFDLPTNTQHQILVRRGASLSAPESILAAPAQPAIFTMNQQGTGQGAIVNGVTNILADTGNPVRVGDVVAIYCTGLGAVSPGVPVGQQASLTTLSRTVAPVTVTIDGRPATVNFAGLAPGFVGLYQVNAVVPAGTATGDSVPIVVSVSGQTSPPATIAVR